MSALPSPETDAPPDDRARQAIAATGLDEATLERLVRGFYAAAREDPVIGAKFDRVADWEAHIATITAFWGNVVLGTTRYQGRPLPAHVPLDLHPPHFARWLELFEATARRICTPEGADYVMERARRIAQSFEMGTAMFREAMAERG